MAPSRRVWVQSIREDGGSTAENTLRGGPRPSASLRSPQSRRHRAHAARPGVTGKTGTGAVPALVCCPSLQHRTCTKARATGAAPLRQRYSNRVPVDLPQGENSRLPLASKNQ